LRDFSYLQLHQCEASSSSCFSVVLSCRTPDNGSKSVSRSRRNGSGFGETVGATAGLAAWLFEMDLDAALPVLVEVPIRDDVVVLDRLEDFVSIESGVEETLGLKGIRVDGLLAELTILMTERSQQPIWVNLSLLDVELR
jgi:hypothetical protein